jgi:hypothetical protein
MKIAIVILLALSCLCDLQAHQQPEPLIPESQKTDIIIPTHITRPIKVRVSDDVHSLQIDGHRIATAPLRHSAILRRKLEGENEGEAEFEVEGENLEEGSGNLNESETFDNVTEETSGDPNEGADDLVEDDAFEKVTEENFENPEEGDIDHSDLSEEHLTEPSYEGDEVAQSNGELHFSSFNEYEDALYYALDNYQIDIELVISDANSCIRGLNPNTYGEGRKLDEGVHTANAGVINVCLSVFQKLHEIQDLMLSYSHSESFENSDGEEDVIEYVDADEIAGDEDEYNNEEILPEENFDEEEVQNNEDFQNSEELQGGEEVQDIEELQNGDVIDSEVTNTEEQTETESEPERRRRIKLMQIRHANKLRHLNTQHRKQHSVLAPRLRRVRRHLRRVPIKRRVIRPHFNGRRVARPVIRRSRQKVLRPAHFVRRSAVQKFHRYA